MQVPGSETTGALALQMWHDLDTVLAILGGFVVLLGLFSRALQRIPISAPLIAFAIGAVIGPDALAILDPSRFGGGTALLEDVSRLVLAITVMGAALALPSGYLRARGRSLALMLGVLMPVMTLAAALVVHASIEVDWRVAFLVGAILAPTDPVLSRSVVSGDLARRALPERTRNLLLAESGANDGAAYPLVMLPLLVGSAESVSEWLHRVLVVQVAGAIVAGALLGSLAGRLIVWAENRKLIDDPHFLIFSVALSLCALGLGRLLDVDALLMVFVTGLALAHGCRAGRLRRQRRVQDAVNEVAIAAVFLLFGMVAPWAQWISLGLPAAWLVVGLLMLRRLPSVLLLAPAVPAIRGLREAALVGWFGPIGVGALFYAALAQRHLPGADVFVVPSLLVAASIVAFAATTAPIVGRLAAHTRR